MAYGAGVAVAVGAGVAASSVASGRAARSSAVIVACRSVSPPLTRVVRPVEELRLAQPERGDRGSRGGGAGVGLLLDAVFGRVGFPLGFGLAGRQGKG